MTSVNDDSRVGAAHVGRLLGMALLRIRAEILATTSERFPGLRVSHYRLLELIPPDGARITDLAEIATMTKQGLGQHVDYLQRLGYTTSERLPEDRRVRLVRRTPLGDEALAYSQAAIARVEERWSRQLGPDRYESFRQTLRELGAD
ncbi:MarR family winged helix-turn-helix transcriptional regulator [Kribbella sp. NPDC048915]|uniref:MarR family winged helix-turn-helix transcriptional regulator n=1 Tax=Kribbella sp. NPDC048915 TaxID=3155148 RepID=UPI0033F754E9